LCSPRSQSLKDGAPRQLIPNSTHQSLRYLSEFVVRWHRLLFDSIRLLAITKYIQRAIPRPSNLLFATRPLVMKKSFFSFIQQRERQ
jgi:hypothetical protein